MWDYLAAHPWWGLIYLLVVCFTASFISMAVASAINRRTNVLTFGSQKDDVVH